MWTTVLNTTGDVDIEFDGGADTKDGIFKLLVNYLMVHSDGTGTEKGTLILERSHVGGMWTTVLKTTASPLGGKPIIPVAISNIELKLESDRRTKFNAKYVNPTKNRDMHVHLVRVPGQSAHIEIMNGARKHDLTFKVGDLDFKTLDGVFKIEVEGTSLGEPINGFVKGAKSEKGHNVQVQLERGNKKLLQLDSKIKADLAHQKLEAKIKYALLGKISGSVIVKFGDYTFFVKNTDTAKQTIEFTVKATPGEPLIIEGKKNGESMWTYKIKRTTTTGRYFELILDSDITLNSNSMIHKFLTKHYPYGAFNTRHNKLHVFVNKYDWNKLAPKFMVEAHLQKDGAKVVDLTLDTTDRPYKFQLVAPNFFTRWGISQPSIDVVVDHRIGNWLIIDANILGGLSLEVEHGDNAKGGRDVLVLTEKAGVQMFKLTISTEKINNDNEFKFILHDTFDVNTEAVLYKNLISKYKFLTPFNGRIGELEFFINKQERNVLLRKFYLKGKVMKDGAKAAELLLTTNEKPYKFELFAPALLKHIKSGWNKAIISVEHNPGQLLHVMTNFGQVQQFKISKTGSGNQREIEINGQKLATGDYTLTDNSFSTKITLGGDWIEPKITWEGKLPTTQAEAEAFFLKNNIQVHVTGSKRNLDLNLNWKMTKPDWNLETPENGKLSLNAKGNNPLWGDYSLSRDLNWSIANKVIEVNWTGSAAFATGLLAPASPIETEFKFKVLLDERDLIGKFMKKFNGKEYSIDFPQGSGALPKIQMGLKLSD